MTINAKPQRKAPTRPDSNNDGASKLDRLVALLSRDGGATLQEMTELTGWQAHSVRGAIAGSLKKRGHMITSAKEGGVRHYRIGPAR